MGILSHGDVLKNKAQALSDSERKTSAWSVASGCEVGLLARWPLWERFLVTKVIKSSG